MQFGFVIYLFRPILFFLWSRQQTAWWSKQRSTCLWFKYIRAGVTFSRFYSTENATACCSSRQNLWWVYRKMLPVPIDTKRPFRFRIIALHAQRLLPLLFSPFISLPACGCFSLAQVCPASEAGQAGLGFMACCFQIDFVYTVHYPSIKLWYVKMGK